MNVCTIVWWQILWCEAETHQSSQALIFAGLENIEMKNENFQSKSYLRAPRENLIGEDDVVEDLPSEPNDFPAEENFPLDEIADVAFAAEA